MNGFVQKLQRMLKNKPFLWFSARIEIPGSTDMDTTNPPLSCDCQSSSVSCVPNTEIKADTSTVANSMISNHSEEDLSSDDETCKSEELRQIHQQPEQGKDDIVQGSDQEEGERSDTDQTSCDVQQQSEETIVQGIDQEEGERSDRDVSSDVQQQSEEIQQQSEEIHPAIGSGDFG